MVSRRKEALFQGFFSFEDAKCDTWGDVCGGTADRQAMTHNDRLADNTYGRWKSDQIMEIFRMSSYTIGAN